MPSHPQSNPEALRRREVLRIGAVSILGTATSLADSVRKSKQRGSCIFMMLQGGLSQIDLWDPKPQAVSEIRGSFRQISTTVPGMEFGELMSATAGVANELCVIRSMTHKFTNHIAGTYITLTGSSKQQDRDREAHGDDFPGPGGILNQLQPLSSTDRVPRSVSLPNWLSIPGPSNRMPGQFAGFLGSVRDPFLIEGDPSKKDYRPLSLSMPDGVNGNRMSTRIDLARQLDSAAAYFEQELSQRHDHLQQAAFDLVTSGTIRKALDLSAEPDALRDRYGRNRVGQSLLLARRLVEAGVQFVSFNEFNQKWDTHGGLEGRYKQIVPEIDRGFATLVADLKDRGLLDTTMVVNAGEFGRTPQINNKAGRDHWPNVYSTVLAGGGIRGGTVIGASDSKGAEVLSSPVSPADVLATMWQSLGIPPDTTIHDRLARPMPVSDGQVLHDCLLRSGDGEA
ncbi:MAG TPA: DUF1501 domain-containing protein [Planctomycetes bacterium]|nr:DUF1501 domain-containing protein [Fuerstiella sp.]HIK91692.1 DUF1501 domain-containing protein [Planctomycetota bacterium]